MLYPSSTAMAEAVRRAVAPRRLKLRILAIVARVIQCKLLCVDTCMTCCSLKSDTRKLLGSRGPWYTLSPAASTVLIETSSRSLPIRKRSVRQGIKNQQPPQLLIGSICTSGDPLVEFGCTHRVQDPIHAVSIATPWQALSRLTFKQSSSNKVQANTGSNVRGNAARHKRARSVDKCCGVYSR
jgi:hypothetical protein